MSEQTYARVDLATEQLDMALVLFLEKHSYVSALTLAGAAEEIFGKALAHQGKEYSLKWKFGAVAPRRRRVSDRLRGKFRVEHLLRQSERNLSFWVHNPLGAIRLQ